MNRILFSLLSFIFFSICSFSSQEDSAKKTLEFAQFLFSENYFPRNLEDVKEPLKIKYSYEQKDYFLYSGQDNGVDDFTISSNFFVGWEYAIIGSSDFNLKDIDIYIYDSSDILVSIDRNSSNIAFPMLNRNYIDVFSKLNTDLSIEGKRISLKPLKSGVYTIKIKSRNENNVGGFWTLMILARKPQ